VAEDFGQRFGLPQAKVDFENGIAGSHLTRTPKVARMNPSFAVT
jgi:hypothetical protein